MASTENWSLFNRIEAREAGDIDRRFGMARADQNAAVAGAEREDMARCCDIGRGLAAVDGDGHGAGAVMGGNAG